MGYGIWYFQGWLENFHIFPNTPYEKTWNLDELIYIQYKSFNDLWGSNRTLLGHEFQRLLQIYNYSLNLHYFGRKHEIF